MSEENYNIQNNEGEQFLKNDFDNDKVYGYERQKFKGFGEYNNPLLKENEGEINELVEITKKSFPTMDNYLIWLCAVDYMIEKLGIQNEVGIEDVKRSTDAVYYGVQVE
jgi:hypothetical protein